MTEEHSDNKSMDIPLAETIQTLREQLQLAQTRSTDESLVFQIENVELELTVVVGRKTSGEGGIQFYVLRAGGGVERSGETTHHLKLTLSPRTKAGGRVNVSSETTEAPKRG